MPKFPWGLPVKLSLTGHTLQVQITLGFVAENRSTMLPEKAKTLVIEPENCIFNGTFLGCAVTLIKAPFAVLDPVSYQAIF